MKTSEGDKVVKIREAFGSIRQILVEGESYYREARRDDVVFECPADEIAWDVCGPRQRVHVDLVNGE